jgi:AsmA protein
MLIIRMVKWLAIALVLVVSAGALYLGFADLAWLKPRIESAVAEGTGRELKIEGRFDFNLLPTLSLTMEDVSFANASWGSQPVMVNIGHLSGKVVPWSLVSGPLRIREIHLHNLDLLLETSEGGEANWALAGDDVTQAPPDGDATGGGLPLLVEFAEIRNVAIRYKQSGADDVAVTIASIDIDTDRETYTFIDAVGQVGEKPLKLAARAGPERALVAGSGINIDAAPAYGEYTVQAAGVLTAEPEAWLLQDWTASYKDLSIQLQGSLGRATEAGTEVAIRLAGPSLRSLDPNLPASPIDLSLAARLDAGKLVLDAIDARVGKSDLSGTLRIDMVDKTAISGKLRSKRLDLTALAPPEQGQAGSEPAPRESPHRAYVFTEEPLPFDRLDTTDLDLDTHIDSLVYRNMTLSDVATRITLKGGNLLVTNTFTGSQGGRAAGEIALVTSDRSASLDLDLRMRDLRLNLASGDVTDPDQIPPIDITLDIRSSGGSPRALASSASGRLLLTQGAGLIENKLIGMFGGDFLTNLFSALNPFSEEDEFTNTECAILALDVTGGDADITALYAQGAKVKYVGDGEIDLGSEALDIEFRTAARKGVGVSPAMFATPFVKLKGTLASPSIALDKKGALLAAGTGGLSVILRAVVDRFSSGEDQCAETLASVGGHPPLTD